MNEMDMYKLSVTLSELSLKDISSKSNNDAELQKRVIVDMHFTLN